MDAVEAQGRRPPTVFCAKVVGASAAVVMVVDVGYAQSEFNYDVSTTFSTDCGYEDPCSFSLGIAEPFDSPKKLFKIYDMMGRETTYKANTLLIYLYDDGSAEKKYTVE